MCTILKDKAADFFQPLQFGVACQAGAEKILHCVRGCIEDHWMDEDFVCFKKNAFNLVSNKQSSKNVPLISRSCFRGSPTATGPIHSYGIHLDSSAQNAECSRVTP